MIEAAEEEDGEYQRLRVTLEVAVYGELVFVQIDEPKARERLPERLLRDGLGRPWIYVNLMTEEVHYQRTAGAETRVDPLPQLSMLGGLPRVLRELLHASWEETPRVVFLDGLERHLREDEIPGDGDPLEQLSQAREALAALPAVVVFLLPVGVVQLLREKALNLWSWRAYDFVLDGTGVSTPSHPPDSPFRIFYGHPRADHSEARAQRIHVYRNLLAEQEARGRRLPSLYNDYVWPLLDDLRVEDRFQEALALVLRTREHLEEGEDVFRVLLLVHDVMLLRASGKDADAALCITELRRLSPELPPHIRYYALEQVAYWDIFHGQPQESLQPMRQCVAEIRADASMPAERRATLLGVCVPQLARVLRTSKCHEEARALLETTLAEIKATQGDYGDAGVFLHAELARAYREQGRLHKAAQFFAHTAEEAVQRFGRHRFLAEVLQDWGELCIDLSDYPQAERHLKRSLEVIRHIFGEGRWEISALAALANLSSLQGHYADAEDMLHRCLDKLHHSPDRSPTAHLKLAILLAMTIKRRSGSPAEGQRILKVALADADRPGVQVPADLRATGLQELGLALLAQKLPALAESYLSQALALTQDPQQRADLQGRLSKTQSKAATIEDILRSAQAVPPLKPRRR